MRDPALFRRSSCRLAAMCIAALSFWTACSDEATIIMLPSGDAMVPPGSGETPEPDAPAPVYALMTQVYNLDDRSVYVLSTDTLDPVDVSLDGAREYPGVANIAAINGKLMVSSGEAPVITAF